MPTVYKDLTVGSPTFLPAKEKSIDSQGYEIPGWAAPGPMMWDKQQPMTAASPKGWVRTGDTYAKLRNARSRIPGYAPSKPHGH